MGEKSVRRLLDQFATGNSASAWSEFLRHYARAVLHVVRLHERTEDRVADCFLYVCEELSRRRFRRLRKFRTEGPASFATWLRVVTRNLCLDWRRQQLGRPRILAVVGRASPLDREVFRCRFRERLGFDQTLAALLPSFPGLSEEDLAASESRVFRLLSSRQRWQLLARARDTESIDDPDAAGAAARLSDPAPDPETLAATREQRRRLNTALSDLPPVHRLMLRLRFEQSLTLEQVARLTGLANAQSADRQIRQVLGRLRVALGGGTPTGRSGNEHGGSV